MVVLSVLLSFSIVQTSLAKTITARLNSKYETSIMIEKVDLSSLRNLELENILIKDHHQDSLIYVNKLSTSVLNFRKIFKGNLLFADIEVENAIFNLKTYKGEENNNLNVFTEKFKKESDNSDKPFRLTSSSVFLNQVNFNLIDENKSKEPIVFYHNISGYFDGFKVHDDHVSASIHDLRTNENHHLNIIDFETKFSYSSTKMEFKNTRLKTKNSNFSADIIFKYDEGDFSNFTENVNLEAEFYQADIALVDLRKFYNEFGKNDVIHFKTKARGTINNLELIDFELASNRDFELIGSFSMKNLIQNKNFELKADIDKLTSNYDHLISLLPNILGKKIPTLFERIGSFTSSGKVNVTKSSIYSKLNTQSDIGSFKTDIELVNFNNVDKAIYKGQIDLEEFDLGTFIGDSLVGNLSMTGEIEGKGFQMDKINTKVIGLIRKHQYKGYTYSDIDINGFLKDRHFNGELNVNDPNINLTFKGLADLSAEEYEFDFKADVNHADFLKLNLFTRDERSILKGKIDINLRGSNLDNMVGEIHFKESTYINQNEKYYFKDFNVSSFFKDSIREVRVNSTDIINGFVRGNFKFKDLKKLSKNSIGSLFVNYQKEEVANSQFLEFNFNIYNKIVEVFFPDVRLGANTIIRGEMDSDKDKLKLSIKSPDIVAFENEIENIRLQVDNKNPLYHTLLSVDKVNSKHYNIANVNLVNVTLNDTLFMRTDFIGGNELKEKFNLSFYYTINENNQFVFGFKSSELVFKNNTWKINPENNNQNKFVFDNKFKNFAIDNIDAVSEDQYIGLAGLVYDNDNKNIDLKFENVNLYDITPNVDSVAIDGKVNGVINLKSVNGNTLPLADMTINYFSINDDFYGDLTFNARGDKSIKNYNYQAKLVNGDLISFYSKGKLDFVPEKPTISAEIVFNNFKISAFSPLGKTVLSEIRGYASGRTFISGNIENPKIDGEINLEEAGIALPYLNVNYNFLGNTRVKLYDQTFDFLNISLQDDIMKTTGILQGKISHKNFKNWNLDLGLTTDNLLVLNTEYDEEKEDVVYYGTGLLSGSTTLKGPTDDLVIDVRGKTNKGTEIIIPLNYLSTISETKLITFDQPEILDKEIDKKGEIIFKQLKGLTLNFDLEVTKDAIAQVVIDKVSGSLLRGSGDGNLKLNIDTNGRFEIFGVLVIDNGEYQFKNIINKNFKMKRGGTIVWNGNPYDAELNIEAINITKANPSVLLDELNSSRKIDVELITVITGTLSSANFDFDINIPNASSLVSSELEFKLNNEDDKLTQFVSLLATGNFINLEKSNSDFGSAALSGTIAQKASSMLTQILKSSNENIEVDVTYDVGKSNSVEDVITDDQLGISVSGRIADRVIVHGKVGVPVGSNTNSSVIGEVEVEIPLNEAETLSAKVYNRQNEIQFDVLEGEGYTQGAGISYQFNFDNGDEFLTKLGIKKSKEAKEASKKEKDSLRAIKKSEKNKK